MSVLEKVTAFVVTQTAPRQLLVFQHPTAGLQLPAGTVEPGEEPIAAAKREVLEETGVDIECPGIVLDVASTKLEADQGVLLETVVQDARIFQRGRKVRVLARDNLRGIARIREEILDYNTTPPKSLAITDGEVPTDVLSNTVRRTFVLFVAKAYATAPWFQQADGHNFEVRWVPLAQDIPLVAGQKEWLEANHTGLRSALRSP